MLSPVSDDADAPVGRIMTSCLTAVHGQDLPEHTVGPVEDRGIPWWRRVQAGPL